MQGLGCPLGSVFVDEAQADADHQDDPDDDRLSVVAQEGGQHRGTRQQKEHGVVQLTSEHRERADVVRADGVGAVCGQA